MYKQWSIY